MNELLELNQRLSYLQGEFVNEVIKRGFWGPSAFLEEKEITDLDDHKHRMYCCERRNESLFLWWERATQDLDGATAS